MERRVRVGKREARPLGGEAGKRRGESYNGLSTTPPGTTQVPLIGCQHQLPRTERNLFKEE